MAKYFKGQRFYDAFLDKDFNFVIYFYVIVGIKFDEKKKENVYKLKFKGVDYSKLTFFQCRNCSLRKNVFTLKPQRKIYIKESDMENFLRASGLFKRKIFLKSYIWDLKRQANY